MNRPMATRLVGEVLGASGSGGSTFGGLIAIALFWALPIYLAKRIGTRRGRRYTWILGLVLSWLGVLIVALLLSRATDSSAVAGLDELDDSGAAEGPASGEFGVRAMRPCPECRQEIRAEARICRHCGHRIDLQAPQDA